VAVFNEGEHDDEYDRNHGVTGDATGVEEADKRVVQPPTEEEVELLLNNFFRIIEAYCEKKDPKTWKKKFINYWAGKRTVNVGPLDQIG
jgi:hypothetical protein